ncbi:hypothetical protein [Pseudomonas sp. 210_17 TE3656]
MKAKGKWSSPGALLQFLSAAVGGGFYGAGVVGIWGMLAIMLLPNLALIAFRYIRLSRAG